MGASKLLGETVFFYFPHQNMTRPRKVGLIQLQVNPAHIQLWMIREPGHPRDAKHLVYQGLYNGFITLTTRTDCRKHFAQRRCKPARRQVRLSQATSLTTLLLPVLFSMLQNAVSTMLHAHPALAEQAGQKEADTVQQYSQLW